MCVSRGFFAEMYLQFDTAGMTMSTRTAPQQTLRDHSDAKKVLGCTYIVQIYNVNHHFNIVFYIRTKFCLRLVVDYVDLPLATVLSNIFAIKKLFTEIFYPVHKE